MEKTATASLPWTRQNPFPGRLIVNRRLSGPDSAKDTRHFEIDLTDWGLSFEGGCADVEGTSRTGTKTGPR
jgi:sulfite reductase (NADPH) flavoprotein alpha-component